MQVTFDHVKLRQCLKRVAPAINSKTIMPVLDNVLLTIKKNSAVFTATDMQCFLITECECTAAQEASILLPFNEFSRIAQVVSGPLTIAVNGKQASITSGKDVFKLVLEQQTDLFPKLPTFEALASFELDNVLIGLISKMALITKTDAIDNRLEHVCFDCREGKTLQLLASDGYRAARYLTGIATTVNAALPLHKTHARMLGDVGACTFSFNDKWAKAESLTLTAYMLNGDIKYPDVASFFSNITTSFNVHIQKEDLDTSIDKVLVYKTDLAKLSFSFGKGEAVGLYFNDPAFGNEFTTDLPAVQTVEETRLGLDGNLLKSLLTCFPQKDEIKLDVVPGRQMIYMGSRTDEQLLCLLGTLVDV